MNKPSPLVVSGIVFTIVALAHLVRIFYHWEVLIAGLLIPMWVSIVALIVAGILAIWMFLEARSIKQ